MRGGCAPPAASGSPPGPGPLGPPAQAANAATRGCGPAPRGAAVAQLPAQPCGLRGAWPPRWVRGCAPRPDPLRFARLVGGPLVPRCRLRRLPPPFLRTSRPAAPGPFGPVRSSAPARRARPLCAPFGPGPPAPSLGPCAPLRGSAGSRWPRLVPGSCFARLRAPPLGSPLLRSALPSPQRVAPRVPPGPSALRASGGPLLASLVGARAPAPGGLRGPSGRLLGPPAPRGFGCAPAPARAC